MKSLYFGLLINLFVTTIAIGQQRGHIATDSTYLEGYVIDRGTFINHQRIEFSKYKSQVGNVYSPGDLKEFGFEKGKTYVSKPVTIGNTQKGYFLLRLMNGNAKLYSLKIDNEVRFFGEHGNIMMELKKDSLSANLGQLLNKCNNVEWSAVSAKYRKKSLKRAFKLYNSCYTGLYPRIRTGFSVGVGNNHLKVSREVTKPSLVYPSGQMNLYEESTISLVDVPSTFVGAFIDFPLGLRPTWYMNAQLNYESSNFHDQRTEGTRSIELNIDTKTLSLPLLIKYRTTSLKTRRFFNVGPTISYYLKQENKLSATSSSGSISETGLYKMTKTQLSGTIGIGLEHSILKKNSISIELRYNNGIGVGSKNKGNGFSNSENQHSSSLQLITALYF